MAKKSVNKSGQMKPPKQHDKKSRFEILKKISQINFKSFGEPLKQKWQSLFKKREGTPKKTGPSKLTPLIEFLKKQWKTLEIKLTDYLMKNRQTSFFGLSALFLIVFLGWSWAIVGVYGPSIKQSSRELKEIQDRFQNIEFIKNNRANMINVFENSKVEFDTLKSSIPDNDSYIILIKKIRTLVNKHGIKIISLSPKLLDSFPAIKTYLTNSQVHIERYPVQVKLFGDYKKLGTFLEELLALPSIVNIGRLTLGSELTQEGGISCELILFTYMYKKTMS